MTSARDLPEAMIGWRARAKARGWWVCYPVSFSACDVCKRSPPDGMYIWENGPRRLCCDCVRLDLITAPTEPLLESVDEARARAAASFARDYAQREAAKAAIALGIADARAGRVKPLDPSLLAAAFEGEEVTDAACRHCRAPRWAHDFRERGVMSLDNRHAAPFCTHEPGSTVYEPGNPGERGDTVTANHYEPMTDADLDAMVAMSVQARERPMPEDEYRLLSDMESVIAALRLERDAAREGRARAEALMRDRASAEPFGVGDRVWYRAFGFGRVQEAEVTGVDGRGVLSLRDTDGTDGSAPPHLVVRALPSDCKHPLPQIPKAFDP